jgi:hypothetical protein
MRKLSLAFFVIFAISSSAYVSAQERLQMEGTEITGNVPWKSAERFEISSPPITSIMDRKLTPIERAAFKRKIHYHDAIFTKAKLQ